MLIMSAEAKQNAIKVKDSTNFQNNTGKTAEKRSVVTTRTEKAGAGHK